MTITLSNNAELNPIVVIGDKRVIHDETRDTLSFVFPTSTSLDELDALFTPKNCETITLTDAGTTYVYNGYTVRAELKRYPEIVTSATDTEPAVVENRVTVAMSQRTYAENQLASVQAAVEMLCMEDTMEV